MSKRKLLLADDSITIQKVVNLTFADEGVEVISVGDGNSAMDKLREDSPDLVMADVNMPGLNGYEICEKIKLSDKDNRQIPVILLVGSFEPFDEKEAKRVGADDYLTKPFQSISQLVEKVTALLDLEDDDQSFADTTEMFVDEENSETEQISSGNSADNSFVNEFNDDEMIQTAQVGSVPIDDAVKFDSTSEIPNVESEADISELSNDSETPDFNKTQPFTKSDLVEISAESSEHEEIKGSNGEMEFEETIKEDLIDDSIDSEESQNSTKTSETEEFQEESIGTHDVDESNEYDQDLPMPEAASVLELDEINLLDLPPLEGANIDSNIESEEDEEAKSLIAAENEFYTKLTAGIDVDVPQELKNKIAKEVIERVSEKNIREIAWEVVPELAELIIQKMAKEKIED